MAFRVAYWTVTEVARPMRKLVVQAGGGQNHGEANQCCQYKLYMGPLAPSSEDSASI